MKSTKDEQFYLAQEKLRTEIRIKQGREKPIDFFNKVLMIWNGLAELPVNYLELQEYREPFLLLDILDEPTLRELLKDLNTQLEIELQRAKNKNFVVFSMDIAKNFEKNHNLREEDLLRFIEYWRALINLTEQQVYLERSAANIPEDLKTEIKGILADKHGIKEIEELEKEIEETLEAQVSTEDVNYWKNAYLVVKDYKCRFELKSQLDRFLSLRAEEIEKLRQKKERQQKTTLKIEETAYSSEEECESPPMYESDEEMRQTSVNEHDYLIRLAENRKFVLAKEINKRQKKESVPVVKEYKEEDEVEEFLKTKRKRPLIPANSTFFGNRMDALISSGVNVNDAVVASRYDLNDETGDFNLTREMQMIESQELGEGEDVFTDEVKLRDASQISPNYRPRKPRFFNRVRSGYEWTKYNQLHFDFDNPPPKTIQGYKFNIFYPDLIDKAVSPYYVLERAVEPGMCIIRFKAGAPYEDVAFKIPNREWDMTEKGAFKNEFERGILYLYFNYKRYRYKI